MRAGHDGTAQWRLRKMHHPKKKYKTIRLSEEEYLIIAEVQRVVKRKGYDALRAVIEPDATIQDEERFTKKKVIELGSVVLLRRLSRGQM